MRPYLSRNSGCGQNCNGTPKEFVLYGGTALALRLGHRQSEDFDFFSTQPFDPARLQERIAYLQGVEVSQRLENTLTCLLDRRGEIHVSFFGDGDLQTVPTDIQKRLRGAVQEVDLEQIPTFAPQQGLTMSGREP